MQTRKIRYDFRGAHAPPLVASRDGGPWCSIVVDTAGSPTVLAGNDGMTLTLDATNEAQSAGLYMGNVLPFDIDDIIRAEFIAKASASLGATVQAIFGFASAQNADPDAIAQGAWFKLAGSNSLVVETDDGTTNNDDVSADGETLSTTFKRFAIDFSTGITTQSPPSQSLGGKSNVQFHMGNTNGHLRRVAKNTRFDMSAYAGNLQLIAQIQKTASTATGTLSILEIEVEYKLPV